MKDIKTPRQWYARKLSRLTKFAVIFANESGWAGARVYWAPTQTANLAAALLPLRWARQLASERGGGGGSYFWRGRASLKHNSVARCHLSAHPHMFDTNGRPWAEKTVLRHQNDGSSSLRRRAATTSRRGPFKWGSRSPPGCMAASAM